MAKKPNQTDVYVGGRVRQARLLIGMSQEKLAAPLGLTFQQVQKYEKGTNRIGSSRMQQIAVTLGRPVAWFFEGVEGGVKTDDPVREFGTKSDGLRLMRAYTKCPRSIQQAIVNLAEAGAAA